MKRRAGAGVGGAAAAIGSIPADVATGGANIPLTGLEIAAGAAAGARVGSIIGAGLDLAEVLLSSDYRKTALDGFGISKDEADGLDVHHVVMKGDSRMAVSSAVLTSVGIGLNDFENLLPTSRGDHQTLHTDLYVNTVNAMLATAAPGGRGAVVQQLNIIKAGITSGTFPH